MFIVRVLLLLSLFSQKGFSQVSVDVDQMEFYLHTVEVGDLVFNNFGHTAIRVVDHKNGRDYIFNWGVFDFGEPLNFAWRFYKGHLRYKLGVYAYANTLTRYRAERRTVWQDRFHLTSSEKKIFWRRLSWNMRAENRYYNYQYFFDNCSTRPRDYINEALSGRLQQAFSVLPTKETFRDMVNQHYATNPFIAMGLDIVMNQRIDKTMSAYEKMFLPKSLRSYLLSYRSPNGEPILIPDKTLFTFDKPQPKALSGFQIFFLLFLVLFVIPALGFYAVAKNGGGGLPWGVYRFMGLSSILYGSYTGLLGILFPLNWLFSDHLDLHHNANLWFFWPSDFLLVLVGLCMLVTGKCLSLSSSLEKLLKGYCALHIICALLCSLLYSLNIIEQGIAHSIIYMLPILLVLYGFHFRFGTKDQ